MEVTEMGWYANSFSIPFDYSKRKDSEYLKKLKKQILNGINEYIKYNGLYSDSGAIMPKLDSSFIFEGKSEAETYIGRVIEDKGYDYSIAVPYNDFSASNGEFEKIIKEMNETEDKRMELSRSASEAIMSKKTVTCRYCGQRQYTNQLKNFKCINCNSDVRSITKLNQRKALFNKWLKLDKKRNAMRSDKKYIFLLIRFAFHC